MRGCNILIVEDHALTRFALLTSLKDEDFTEEIFEAENAQNAYKILKEHKIDVVLMDLGLPVIDGVTASAEIKKNYPDIKIIVITSHNEQKEVEGCLEAGISAYCSKDIDPKKLIELIKDVMTGSMWFDSSVSKIVMQKTAGLKQKEEDTNNKYNLTSKELSVLSLLANGNSNNEIAKKLNISINTTKVHMCSILQKLSVDDRTQAAIKAIRENLI
ncbi:TPA: response regulator transcription factor [Candidatus Galligastranaerophilus gallistercoris]|nr:response regulator transcription factor [Candidatus Galligastranaerophilus gallistercoris]